eukprot:5356532-Pyramimonas_sp.AAC.1
MSQGTLRRITAAGGGAHKFKKVFEEVLGVELIPQKELKAVVDGLLLLNTHGPANELFTVEPNTGDPPSYQEHTRDPRDTYPSPPQFIPFTTTCKCR